MTQFSKLYLKLDKEKEHLITFNYSEKYSICSQGVGPRQGWSVWPMEESFQLLSFCISASCQALVGWPPDSRPSKQTFDPNLQLPDTNISKESD